MSFLNFIKEFFYFMRKGFVMAGFGGILAFDVKKKNVTFDQERICELLEDWLYENDYDCMVLTNDTNILTPLTSIVVDCYDYLDKPEDRRKIRILTEMFLDKLKIKYEI